jgi:hypothetical protein
MVIIDAIRSPATRELTAGARLGLSCGAMLRTSQGRPSTSEPGLSKTPAAPQSPRVDRMSSLDPDARPAKVAVSSVTRMASQR